MRETRLGHLILFRFDEQVAFDVDHRLEYFLQ